MQVTESSPFTRSRGMRDLLPERMRVFRRAEDAFRQAAGRWGYDEVRTPTIETFSLFSWAGALRPDMLQRIYSFLDWDGWSGERVVLRPDSTVPVSRAAGEAGIDVPARLSYVQNVFRFSPDDADREEWQFGLEYLGAPDDLGDVETILVATETLETLGLRPVVRLSHAGLLQALVAAVAGSTDEAARLRTAVIEQGLGAFLASPAVDAPTRTLVGAMSSGDGGSAFARNLGALVPGDGNGVRTALNSLEQIASALEAIDVRVEVAPAMVLDFEYYTGVVAQVVVGDAVIASGGRYTAPGEPPSVSACGLAIDVTALLAQMPAARNERTAVPVIPLTPEALPRALEVARTLHRHGLSAAPDGAGRAAAAPVYVEVSPDSTVVVIGGDRHDVQATEDLVARLLQVK